MSDDFESVIGDLSDLMHKGGFRRLYDAGRIQNAIPELKHLELYLHSEKYHPEGNLLEHYSLAFDTLAEIIFRVYQDRPELYELDKRGWMSPLIRRAILGLLFHDIGKPSCAKLNEDKGFHSYIKHESVGGDIFREHYAHYFNQEEAEAIEFVIRQHTNFWNVQKHGKSNAIATNPNYGVLLLVCEADKMGFTLADGKTLEDREWHFRHHAQGVSE